MSQPIRSSHSVLLILLGLFVLFGLGVGVRHEVFASQKAVVALKKAGKEVPFTLESALQYRQVKELLETGKLADVDPMILTANGEGLRVPETYTVGSETYYAGLSKLLPRTWTMENRVRWAARVLFALAIPAFALWIGIESRSITAGLIAGACYAVAYAAVVRSTGQELSRENFALPLLVMALAAQAWSRRSETAWMQVAGALLSGLFLASAQTHWDLIQYAIGLWVVWLLLRHCISEKLPTWQDGLRWWAPLLGLTVVGLTNPYLRSHHFLFSPIMWMGYGLGLLLAVQVLTKRVDRRWQWLLPLAVIVLVGVLAGSYGGNYGHFGSLLSAKISFFNIKPDNPALLTFSQRIMWTPALNSTNWYALFDVFPYVLYLGVLSMAWIGKEDHFYSRLVISVAMCVVLVLFDDRLLGANRLPVSLSLVGFSLIGLGLIALLVLAWRDEEHPGAWLIFGLLISWFTFILFFRFHVFMIFFVGGLLGYGAVALLRRESPLRWVWLPLIALGIFMEMHYVLTSPGKTDRVNMMHADLLDLFDKIKVQRERFVQRTGAPPVILANFGVSAAIRAYTDCPIVLHPKFETEDIRQRVEDFHIKLYQTNEFAFYEWTQELGVQLYVHTHVGFGDKPAVQLGPDQVVQRPDAIRNTARYMANALEVPDSAAVRRLEHGYAWPPPVARAAQKEPPVYFNVHPTRPQEDHTQFYRIYSVITHADLDLAAKQTQMARRFFEVGDYRRSFDYAERAITLYNPNDASARKIIGDITTLIFQGKIDRSDLLERVKMFQNPPDTDAESPVPAPESPAPGTEP